MEARFPTPERRKFVDDIRLLRKVVPPGKLQAAEADYRRLWAWQKKQICALIRQEKKTTDITYTYLGDFGKTHVYHFMKKHFNTIFVKLAGNMKDNKMAFWKACKERLDELNQPEELDEDAPGQTTSRRILKAPFVVFDVPRGGKIDAATLEFFEGYVKSPPYTHEKSEGSQFSIDIEPGDRIRSCLFWNDAPEAAVLRSISESACNVYIVSDTTEKGTLLPDENVKKWQKAYSEELRQRQQAGVEQSYRFAAQQINEAHGIAPDEVDSSLTDCQKEFARILRQKQQAGTLMAYEISDDLVGLKYNEIKLVRDGNTFKMCAIDRVDATNMNTKVANCWSHRCK